MATKEMKEYAFNTALTIIQKAADGGYEKQPLAIELDHLYHKIIQLREDVEKN